MISLGSFDGFEAPTGLFPEAEAKDAEAFDSILDSIAGLMQAMPPQTMPVAQAVATNPKGFNPDIEKLKSIFGIDQGPTAVNPSTQEPGPVTAPILVNPHVKVETVITRQPPRIPDATPTPDIIIVPGKVPGKEPVKQPPIVTQTPDIIVLPKTGDTKKPPVVAQTPDIIVMPTKDPVKPTPDIIVVPPKEPVKQTPDIIVMPGGPVKQPPKLPPVVNQTPDIIVMPPKNPVKQPPVNEQTPDIIVMPTQSPVRKLPLATIETRKPDAHLSEAAGLLDRLNGALANPASDDVEISINPTGVREAGGELNGFDPSRVRIMPRLDAGRTKGFTVTPDSLDAVVQALAPPAATSAATTAATTSPLTPQSAAASDAMPRFNEVSEAINATLAPATAAANAATSPTASNLSRFWVAPQASTAPTVSGLKKNEIELESAAGPETKPVEPRIAGAVDAIPARPSLLDKITADVKTVTEPTLVKPAVERNDDAAPADAKPGESSPNVKFERFMANAASDVAKPAEARTEQAAAKVTEQVNPHLVELAAMASRKQEKQSMKLRLHPAELGSVEIRLERADSGAISAFFTTETDGARQALTQNMDQLRESLRQSGFQVGQMEVASGGPSDGGRQQRDAQQPRNSPVFNDFFTATPTETIVADERNSPNRLLSLLA